MKKIFFLNTFIVGAILLSSCSLPTITISSAGSEESQAVEPDAIIPETGSTEEMNESETLEAEEMETAPAETEIAETTETPEAEIAPVIEHLTQPVEPAGKYQTIHDQTSDKYADQNRAYGGDDYAVGRYERSFLLDMTYLPFIDILKAELNREDENWVIVRMQLMDDPSLSGDLNPLFGVELDYDLDNRGEYLILANVPGGTDWTTEGVQVFEDLDGDVGGAKPVKPDDAGGNGYENLIFDAGLGDDSDLAWVRTSPEGPNYVEIAYKNVLSGGEKGKFIWLPWALGGITDPAFFEFNDHLTLAEAGSPLREDQVNYPLKNLWGIDNTCRGASGIVPQPSNTGVCPISEPEPGPEAPQPGNPPPPNFNPPPLTHQ